MLRFAVVAPACFFPDGLPGSAGRRAGLYGSRADFAERQSVTKEHERGGEGGNGEMVLGDGDFCAEKRAVPEGWFGLEWSALVSFVRVCCGKKNAPGHAIVRKTLPVTYNRKICLCCVRSRGYAAFWKLVLAGGVFCFGTKWCNGVCVCLRYSTVGGWACLSTFLLACSSLRAVAT